MANKLQTSIIRTLLYFDIFNYPLKTEEVLRFLDKASTPQMVERELIDMSSSKTIKAKEGYFGINGSISAIDKRKYANQFAKQRLPKAHRMAKLISKFPFVTSVSLSGTISKGVMEKDSDIDFFIITQSNRLWVAKFFLVLYKRIFLGNSRKNFCINYLISEEDLEIKEKNIFTATELATLIPIRGYHSYHKFIKTNQWFIKWLPNSKVAPKTDDNQKLTKPLWSKILTAIFKSNSGNRFDLRIMNRVQNQYKKQYRHQFTTEEFELMFRSTRTQSKVHNSNHQHKVLEQLENSVSNFLTKHQIAE